jgi:dihydrofolate reductase
MGKVRVNAFGLSMDGFGAAQDQSLQNPFGIGGMAVMEWFTRTETFHKQIGLGDGGSAGVDNDIAKSAMEGLGAWILGRNMFDHARGEWDMEWKGWWGPNPPYHVPVFVLTHFERPPLEMEGGTVFHFVTGGVQEALKRAREAAGDKDIRVGGGSATIRQFLEAGLIDEAHFTVSPVLLGQGESPINGLNLPALGYHVADKRMGDNALHVFIRKQEAV